MLEIVDQAMSWVVASPHVRVLADLDDQWDGTSNGAIMSLVVKGQSALGVLLMLAFCWRVYGVYVEKPAGNAGPGGGGGGGGGRDKKIIDEMKYFGLAAVAITLAYPIVEFFLSFGKGAV